MPAEARDCIFFTTSRRSLGSIKATFSGYPGLFLPRKSGRSVKLSLRSATIPPRLQPAYAFMTRTRTIIRTALYAVSICPVQAVTLYICKSVCMYVCMYVRTYVRVCMHACVYVCMQLCIYVCMCACIWMYIRMYVRLYVYVSMYAYMYIRMYMCIKGKCKIHPTEGHEGQVGK